MKINEIFWTKFIIIYLYAVFILNVLSIFYMDRTNNSLDDQMEFWLTLIVSVFIALLAASKGSKFTAKQTIGWLAVLLIVGPIIFFAHVVFNL